MVSPKTFALKEMKAGTYLVVEKSLVPLKKKCDYPPPFWLTRETMPELFSHNRSDMDLSLLGDLIITLIYSP